MGGGIGSDGERRNGFPAKDVTGVGMGMRCGQKTEGKPKIQLE
jgi:hypothetical protein